MQNLFKSLWKYDSESHNLSFHFESVVTPSVSLSVVAESSVKVDVCTHPGSFGEMCIRCGQKLDGDSGVTFGYIHKVYIVSADYFWNYSICPKLYYDLIISHKLSVINVVWEREIISHFTKLSFIYGIAKIN